MFKIIASLLASPPALSEKDKAEVESDPAKLISGDLSSDAKDIGIKKYLIKGPNVEHLKSLKSPYVPFI